MAFCGNCGTKLEDDVKLCPGCGQAVEAPPTDEQPKAEPAAEQTETKQQTDFSAKMANLNNTADTTDQFDKRAMVRKEIQLTISLPMTTDLLIFRSFPPEIVHAFISKIYVYEKKEKWSRTEGNDIDIVFTVGFREQHTVRTSDALAS